MTDDMRDQLLAQLEKCPFRYLKANREGIEENKDWQLTVGKALGVTEANVLTSTDSLISEDEAANVLSEEEYV